MAAGTVPGERRSVARIVLGAPRPVWILVTGTFVNRTGAFFSTFATLFLTDRGISAARLPLVLAGIGVASMVGSLAGGWLSDRVGRRNALVLSMFASAATLLLLAFAPTLPLVVLGVCLVGVCSQSYLPAASALLVDHTRPEDHVPIFAFFRLALNVGAALGPLIAGLIATRSYTLLFGLNGGASALCGLVILVGIRSRGQSKAAHAAPSGPVVPDAAPAKPATAAPGSSLPTLLLCGVLLVVAMIYVQYRATVPLLLVRHGYTTVFYGVLLTLNGALVIAAELPISSLTRRLRWHAVLITGILTMATGLSVAEMAGPAAIVVAAFVVFTVGEMIFAPVANAAIAQLSPPAMVARYQGLLASAQTFGWAFGPAVGTTVLRLSASALQAGTLLLAVACCAAIYLVWRACR